jgi:nitroimidazol reductase NimA-like FMN-containing flavoprotein (pyridoxamine 5'-phosphate oxidase superfamily)
MPDELRADKNQGAAKGGFTPSARSKVKRLYERGHHDRETLFSVLDQGFVCHVAYVIDGEPYVTPTAYWREGDLIYWHGSSASRMLRQVKTGIPVSLNVCLFDGLVLARSGFHSSINYRSATLFGTGQALESEDEKLVALEAFTERMLPGRWAELRPPTKQEVKATTVFVMEIEEASAKIRTGPPGDDEEDYALPVWAGVLPIHTVFGEPEADPRLDPETPVPGYIKNFRFG